MLDLSICTHDLLVFLWRLLKPSTNFNQIWQTIKWSQISYKQIASEENTAVWAHCFGRCLSSVGNRLHHWFSSPEKRGNSLRFQRSWMTYERCWKSYDWVSAFSKSCVWNSVAYRIKQSSHDSIAALFAFVLQSSKSRSFPWFSCSHQI